MRPLFRSLAAIAVAALTSTLLASPATAKPAITLTPGDLPRGADVAGAHLEGKTVVDGAVRVRIKAPTLRLLGKSGSAYVVGTANAQGGHGRIYRVTADGTRTLLARSHPFETLLSGDGATIVTTRLDRKSNATISVYDVASAKRLATRTFKGFFGALDAQADRVLVGGASKTFIWTTSTDSVGVVARDAGYIGDLSADVRRHLHQGPLRRRLLGVPQDQQRRTALALVHRAGRRVQRRCVADRHHRHPVRRPRPRPRRRPHHRRQGAGPLPGPVRLVRLDRLRDRRPACCSRSTAPARRSRPAAPRRCASAPASCGRPRSSDS